MGLNRRVLKGMRNSLIVVLTPICLSPLIFFYHTQAGRCAYGLLLMAVYWATEPIPMEATALLPVVLFPWLGVSTSKQLCGLYLKDSNMLFLGAFVVVVAVERWNLHRRIALRALLLVGSEPRWLMFGFMCVTGFLSMWLSNTATAAMMVPIAHAMLEQLKQNRFRNGTADRQLCLQERSTEPRVSLADEVPSASVLETPVKETISTCPNKENRASFDKMAKGLMLSVCYSANIGGIATLIGTGPNLVNKGVVDRLYGDAAGINFTSWFIFAFPIVLLCLALAWIWLQLLFMCPSLNIRSLRTCLTRGGRKLEAREDAAADIVRNEYAKLGPISFAETCVLVTFCTMLLLWFTRELDVIKGWAVLFKQGYVTDTTVSVTAGVLLFALPSVRPRVCRRQVPEDNDESIPRLLDWKTVSNDLSWGVLIIRGGGFALAEACKTSGLSSDVSDVFAKFVDIEPWLLVIVVSTISAGITEVVSNVATAAVLLPIVSQLGAHIGMNPLYLMLSVTVATSFAFMFPVATAPNTIVFSYGYLTLSDMLKSGLVMNVICISVLQVAINTWGYVYFDLGTYPPWAGNITAAAGGIIADHNNITTQYN